MVYGVITLFIIAIIWWVLDGIRRFTISLFTLSFLPSGIDTLFNHRLHDGDMSTIALIPLVEHLINYIAVLFLNIIDFAIWTIAWIPGVNLIIDIVYTSPDFIEVGVTHRNFLTHSVLNPVFLIAMLALFIVGKILGLFSQWFKLAFAYIVLCAGFAFVGHLLADSMPNAWTGFARINFIIFSAPAFISKIWLYINAFFATMVVVYTTMGLLGGSE